MSDNSSCDVTRNFHPIPAQITAWRALWACLLVVPGHPPSGVNPENVAVYRHNGVDSALPLTQVADER